MDLTKLFQSIVLSSNDAILIVTSPSGQDDYGKIIFANPSFEKLSGYSSNELIGKSPDIFFGPKSDLNRLIVLRNAIQLSKSHNTRIFTYKKDKSVYWADVAIIPIPDANGVFTHYYSIIRDISQDREKEETFNLQTTILEQVQDAVVVFDKNRKVIYWNPFAEKLYQYRNHEMLGTRKFSELYHPADAPVARKAIQTVMQEGFWKGEIQMIRKDGSVFTALVSNRLLLNREDEVIGYVEVSTDITHHKKTQNELEISLREKEVLLKEIHHRVKNNMQIISSLLHLQSMQYNDTIIQEALIESQNRVRSMSMVHEKLYRSTNLSRIAFDDYIRELTHELMDTWVGTNTVINNHYEMEAVEIDIDKAIPCGLLVNELISNALKHGLKDQSSGLLVIKLQRRDAEIILTVENNGAPLPENFNIDKTDTLGMQLIASLTQQLIGEISYKTKPHTIFELRFNDLID